MRTYNLLRIVRTALSVSILIGVFFVFQDSKKCSSKLNLICSFVFIFRQLGSFLLLRAASYGFCCEANGTIV